MKNTFFLCALALTLLSFYSCEEDNDLIFTAVPSEEGVNFSTDFSTVYLLSEETEENIAERFIWNAADFGTLTNVNYDLTVSVSDEPETFILLGTTPETNYSVAVGELLEYAEELGLDNDSSTTDTDNNPNNTGIVYFRLRAYAGTGTGNNTEMLSDITGLNIQIIEQQTGNSGCDDLYALGDALINAQWDWTTTITASCAENVLRFKEDFAANGTFRLFTTEGDWESGLNYAYFMDEAYTIDPILEDADDNDGNFRFIGTPGIYTMVIDQNDKTIVAEESGPLFLLGDATPGGWDWAGATVAEEISPDIWTAELAFGEGTFRFFTVQDDWGSGLNFPYYIDEGYTIDAAFENAEDGDSNFQFIGTTGVSTITINGVEKTISLN